MFGAQLRAILRASAHGKVRLLVPMVAQLREVRQLFEAIDRAKAQLRARGHAFVDVEVGAMIEVPAAALMLPMLLDHFDFVSIGTNDLIQYTLAIDRADEAVSHLYDPWHPAVLQLVAQTIAQANSRGKGVSVCGEMAGDPAFTELLIGMGLRSFSMHPTQVSSIKKRSCASTQPCGVRALTWWFRRKIRIRSVRDCTRPCRRSRRTSFFFGKGLRSARRCL
jgi:phosphotransferase system enzyme I (PtsI)